MKVRRPLFWGTGSVMALLWVIGYFIAWGERFSGSGGAMSAILYPVGIVFVGATATLSAGRLRDAGMSLWWMAAWPLTAPVFWVVVGLLPSRSRHEQPASSVGTGVLLFKGEIRRMDFWVAGFAMALLWATAYILVAATALAGGLIPVLITITWLAMSAGLLYAATALAVARLRDAGVRLRWMAAWPLAGPVFWIVAGLLPSKRH